MKKYPPSRCSTYSLPISHSNYNRNLTKAPAPVSQPRFDTHPRAVYPTPNPAVPGEWTAVVERREVEIVHRRFTAFLPILAALFVVYFAAGKFGLKLAFVNASATAVWPPTGIALAAFLLLGYRVWPAILLGAFLVNLFTAGTVWTSLGIAAGNTLEGAFCFYLTQRFARGRDVFNHPSDVFKFAA